MTGDNRLLSMVVPVRNEEEILHSTYTTLTNVLEGLDQPYEVILVDNASTDATPAIAAELCARDKRWKYLRLSRDFGYQNSITAGMLAGSGEALMVIDADLQDPPELIPEFVALWRQGYDVVYGVRVKRTGEPYWRVLPTMLAMRFISWMSDEVKLPLHSADFRLISRRVRDAFARLPETNRYVRGMIHWLGFRQIGVPYTRRGRIGGHTKVSWPHLVDFTFNAVFGWSIKPLRMFSLTGTALLALTLALTVMGLLLGFLNVPLAAPTAVHLLLLANLGVTALGVGILGEYLAKVQAESRRRPLWLVDYTINLDPPVEIPDTGHDLRRFAA
jgi:dolichol-phosphate mannosyltransferase